MPSRKGASVGILTRKRLNDIVAVRATVMGLSTADLAQMKSDVVQGVLDEGTRRLFAAHKEGKINEFVVLVYQVSMYVADTAGNEIAASILFSLGRQTLPLTRRAFEDERQRLKWFTNWKAIVESVRDGDVARAHTSVHRLVYELRDSYIVMGIGPYALDEPMVKRNRMVL